jgi:YjbE family integral membrane protein
MIGSAGAIGLRILFVLIVDQLLKIGYLKLIGGLLLLWIGIKLVQGEEEGEDGVKAPGSLWAAVRTIIIADAVMSLDNAIAIAAAAHGDMVLVVLGLIISIPLIIFGATLIMLLLNRFPVIVIAGGALLGWIAGEVLATDPTYADWLAARLPHAHLVFSIGGALLTVAVGYFLQWRARHRRVEPVDLAARRSEARRSDERSKE